MYFYKKRLTKERMFDIIIERMREEEVEMEYKYLREKYDKFIYQGYKIAEDEQNIYLKYHFEIEGLTNFQPVLTIFKKNFAWKNLDSNIAKNIAFSIGMVEAISYFKATCSKYFYVKCGKLSKEQIQWFKKLIYLGTGEFRYKNGIKVSQEDFVQIITEGPELKSEEINYDLKDVIIPIGGGKDSNVTLELLKKSNQRRFGFRINLEDVSKKCAETAGLKDTEIIEVKRKMDPNLIELNKQGFLNGHTPFSSMLAFLSYFTAYILGKKYIALSNESSANESNVIRRKDKSSVF